MVAVDTDLSPQQLKSDILHRIEDQLGRQRTDDPNAPRTIDLDLLYYEHVAIHDNGLTLPHPGITAYPFVALPLYEVAPDLILTDTGIALATVAATFKDHTMEKLETLTHTLRKEIHNGS